MNEVGTGLFKYMGAIHIHTNFSDGTGNIDEITKAAKKAGLQWIIVTDHNCLDVQEGIVNGVLTIKGEEISLNNQNHYIALGTNKLHTYDNPKDYTEEVRKNGGFGFAAHPDEKQNRKNDAPAIRWADKKIRPDGIEIWNWFSQWADNYDNRNIFNIIKCFIFRHLSISTPYQETLNWWDELNKEIRNIVPAIGGVDAHALKISKYILPVTVFPYETMFNTITNVVTLQDKLEGDFFRQKEQILNALRKGNNIIVNRNICKEPFKMSVFSNSNEVMFGDSVNLNDNIQIITDIPVKGRIKILKNGKECFCFEGKQVSYQPDEIGRYRIEVTIGNKGYIYTNPFAII